VTLCESWDRINQRQSIDDSTWHSDLAQYLTHLVDLRVAHVESWIESNVQQFKGDHASIEELRRTFDNAITDLRAGVELCRSQCDSCNLICIRNSRSHGDGHGCLTNHKCIYDCTYCKRDALPQNPCGETSVRPHSSLAFLTCHASSVPVTPEITCEPGIHHTYQDSHAPHHRCQVGVHLCGEQCKHFGKRGCTDKCIQVITLIFNWHPSHVHMRHHSPNSPLGTKTITCAQLRFICVARYVKFWVAI
jgi:hypothetical protein